MADMDWPAARRSIDVAISRARREIMITVNDAFSDLERNCNLGRIGKSRATTAILAQVRDSLDDIDQTVPPAEDDRP
jgi:hypothetical protein